MSTLPPLIDGAWLEPRLGDRDLRILDATVQITPDFQVTSGRADWEEEHIPGSAFADLLALSSPKAPRVVLYDAAVLDGGFTSWKLEGRPTCRVPCSCAPATFVARPQEGLVVRKEDVLAAIGDPRTRIVSALGRRSHRGDVAEYGRPGHTRGSRSTPAGSWSGPRTRRCPSSSGTL
jgi:thiosulfate/3-mercaptopyruvate sulfurtransferase